NALPIPDFTMTSPSPQCYNGNYFCFQDNSQPGTGRTLTKAVFLFGDGGVDSTTGPGGQYCHFYPNQNGGCYNPIIRVTNDKGCLSDITKTKPCVVPDIDANFIANTAASCGSTTVPFTNISRVA